LPIAESSFAKVTYIILQAILLKESSTLLKSYIAPFGLDLIVLRLEKALKIRAYIVYFLLVR
jgi:hypothetical protein